MMGRDKIPVAIVVAFAVMVTAGSTKTTFGVLTVSAMISNDLLLVKSILLPSIDIVLGVVTFWIATALLLRREWARKPLFVLAIVLLLVDVAAAMGLLWPRSDQSNSSSSIHAAITWIAYVAVAWMLTTRSAMDYLQQGGSGTASSN